MVQQVGWQKRADVGTWGRIIWWGEGREVEGMCKVHWAAAAWQDGDELGVKSLGRSWEGKKAGP